ncbi:MAG: NAD+ synthase [Pyrobaculum arsenaticum]|uniref:NH(3)-dependent NAD(+) synthetase n=2 Tax=Pyrobaculum arsenaticum TaxID=121277 RepID=A4WJN2_PYRAR|nr:NAD+ synthase [Pyrobaculum arsenaticum]ABP50599.1 NH(3)-dependent NAD(+) synthetase [Pyrobaculum arsenaticum DSM 13514]MCY0890587.1 NAD+ synthase [Pyrobaculum arsenaticum]NYR14472.1 NAD+ synthase [Pyrobaculum arsenaticum]
MITLLDVINSVNYQEARREIEEFIAYYIQKAKVRGAVVGLSGGVDSCTTLALTAEALGPERVIALILPSKATPPQDVEDAIRVARQFGVRYEVIDITPILNAYKTTMSEYDDKDLVARGNLTARIRMSVLYYYANKRNMLVIGTGDKSELMLGYFTKHGDGGVDILPIGDLYKSQVRALARRMGLPEDIAGKPSSPRLWVGQMAESELGFTYAEADLVLYAWELGVPKSKIPRQTGVPPAVVRKILKRVEENAHKLSPPPIAKLIKSRLVTTTRSQSAARS